MSHSLLVRLLGENLIDQLGLLPEWNERVRERMTSFSGRRSSCKSIRIGAPLQTGREEILLEITQSNKEMTNRREVHPTREHAWPLNRTLKM